MISRVLQPIEQRCRCIQFAETIGDKLPLTLLIVIGLMLLPIVDGRQRRRRTSVELASGAMENVIDAEVTGRKVEMLRLLLLLLSLHLRQLMLDNIHN